MFFQSVKYDTAHDRTFIASAQSPAQQALVAEHPADCSVYVEGGFKVWLREKSLTYFILRSDVTQTFTTYNQDEQPEEENDGKERSFVQHAHFADLISFHSL